jgi:hypothetical protein
MRHFLSLALYLTLSLNHDKVWPAVSWPGYDFMPRVQGYFLNVTDIAEFAFKL